MSDSSRDARPYDGKLIELFKECNGDMHAVAESMVDQEVAAGEYEGCSTELELAYTEYMNRLEYLKAGIEQELQ